MVPGRQKENGTALRRIVWFIALWCAGVAAVGALAYAIRLALGL